MALVKRYRRWYASLDVPPDVQGKLGRKRFIKTLDTESRSVAERRAPVVIAQWKAEIEAARGNGDDDIEYFRRALEGAFKPEDRKRAEELIERTYQERSSPVVAHAAGVEPTDLPERSQVAQKRADEWLAQVRAVRLADHLDAWQEAAERSSALSPRSAHVSRAKLERVVETFPTVADCKKEVAQAWVNRLSENGMARGTIKNYLGAVRGYWRFLARQGLADGEPFEKLELPKLKKKNGARRPFSKVDIKRLWMEADEQLKDLIALAAHTGARLDELCNLTVDDTNGVVIEIREGKSNAAARSIPVHKDIEPIVWRLKDHSKDGYLISGLAQDQFGFRSNGIGERFSKMKRRLGYGQEHNFHSIRRFVATSLHEAGVPEPVAANILGHEIHTLSYGVYAGAASMKAKREALEAAIKLV